jgi:hypothetical protein
MEIETMRSLWVVSGWTWDDSEAAVAKWARIAIMPKKQMENLRLSQGHAQNLEEARQTCGPAISWETRLC